MNTSEQLDAVFSAIADPTRRKIIEELGKEERTVVALSGMFRMSLPAVSKHLKVLSKAGLLERERNGKYIIYRYKPQSVTEAMIWINDQRKLWTDGFDKLADYMNKLDKQK